MNAFNMVALNAIAEAARLARMVVDRQLPDARLLEPAVFGQLHRRIFFRQAVLTECQHLHALLRLQRREVARNVGGGRRRQVRAVVEIELLITDRNHPR